jgi:acyl-CoA synthetase (AMP-forming)/AMP-acid ligase II
MTSSSETPVLVHEFLAESARRTPDAVAIIDSSRPATYAEVDALANRFAHTLMRCGVSRGDRVVLALENCVELAAYYFGAMKAGAAAVPLPPGPRSDRLAKAVVDCAPAACVLDPASARQAADAGLLAHIPSPLLHRRHHKTSAAGLPVPEPMMALEILLESSPDTQPDVRQVDLDLAAIVYTSGSTGVPRGVMLTHLNIRANTESIVSYLQLTSTDRVMCVLPFHYVYGLSLLHTHIYVGGSVVINNGFVYPNMVLAAMREHEVTGFAGVPSTFALLLHQSNLGAVELPHLRYVTQAGGGMPPARIVEWLERGPKVPFFVMYGASEATARLTFLPPSELLRKLGSIGRPIPNVQIVVVKDDGEIAGAGELGELVARGANISAGYWGDPEETARRFGPLGFRTGDMGYTDEEGFLYLVGRRHDMMKVGANRVSAKEIEEVINDFPGMHEVAVISAPHYILGETPVAFVVMREGQHADSEALRAFCGSRLAPYKTPSRFLFRDALPKNGAGKIDKEALRQRLVQIEVPTGLSRPETWC